MAKINELSPKNVVNASQIHNCLTYFKTIDFPSINAPNMNLNSVRGAGLMIFTYIAGILYVCLGFEQFKGSFELICGGNQGGPVRTAFFEALEEGCIRLDNNSLDTECINQRGTQFLVYYVNPTESKEFVDKINQSTAQKPASLPRCHFEFTPNFKWYQVGNIPSNTTGFHVSAINQLVVLLQNYTIDQFGKIVRTTPVAPRQSRSTHAPAAPAVRRQAAPTPAPAAPAVRRQAAPTPAPAVRRQAAPTPAPAVPTPVRQNVSASTPFGYTSRSSNTEKHIAIFVNHKVVGKTVYPGVIGLISGGKLSLPESNYTDNKGVQVEYIINGAKYIIYAEFCGMVSRSKFTSQQLGGNGSRAWIDLNGVDPESNLSLEGDELDLIKTIAPAIIEMIKNSS